jgi:MscS family membrane protein
MPGELPAAQRIDSAHSHGSGHAIRSAQGVIVRLTAIGVFVVAVAAGLAQPRSPVADAPPPQVPARTEPPADALGRSTPRGAVIGFLNAARKGDTELARYYLDTRLPGRAAADLAHQLFIVLDTRLPPRLTQISDAAEGSRANPLAPDQERIGTIDGPDGQILIALERVHRQPAGPIWLFSEETLAAVPAAYADAERMRAWAWMPKFVAEWRIGHVRVAEWLAILLGLPAFYLVIVLLNRVLTPPFRRLAQRKAPRDDGSLRNALPAPLRLLLVSAAGRWMFSSLPLSLLVRQTLTSAASVISLIAVTWLVILLVQIIERFLVRRLTPVQRSGTVSLLRVGRRILEVVIALGGMLAVLRYFGVNPTPVLAGLGVGGIAIALAAQKTLENIIAGASLIVDQAVRVGDALRVGTIEGTVEHIGLRSTRIRTLDRTVVSVPNSQIANMSLETLSARDKFWFHPTVGLRYGTTDAQMRLVLDGIRHVLIRNVAVETPSVRVRLLRFGTSSLDVDVFAYVLAMDWAHFLEIQEELLMRIGDVVQGAGTELAFPSQSLYVTNVEAISSRRPEPGTDSRAGFAVPPGRG